MKRILLLLSLSFALFSCTKEEDGDDPLVILAERAEADNETILAYMKTHKLVVDDVNEYENNINWEVVEISDSDGSDVETLFDLVGDNVIEWEYKEIIFKIYYYQINEGEGLSPTVNDNIIVDYKAYNLPNEIVDVSDFARIFGLSDLIGGWQLALPYFKSGTKNEGFPEDCDGCDYYREQIIEPGKGIILIPSSLAYGGDDVMKFDMVLYDVETEI